MNIRTAGGFSLLELVFVAGLGVTLTAVAIPQVLTGLDDNRTYGAARYLATRFQRARMEAVMRSAYVALQFTQTGGTYFYAEYVDGNGNGVLTSDMQKGVDWPHGAVERLSEQFSGVDFGVLPGLPPIDSGGPPPGADPIRLGAANRASFSPAGTATPGTVYIRGPNDAQYAVRILGETGKTRLLKFDRRNRRWRSL